MNEVKKMIKENKISFLYLNIMMYLLILMPKALLSFSKLPIRLGIVSIYIVLVLYELKNKKIKFNNRKITMFLVISGIFLLFSIPSIFVSYATITSIYTFIKFFVFFTLFLILIKIDFTKKELKIILKNIIIASTITIIYGIICYIFDINIFKIGKELYPGSKGRTISTFFNPIYFGIYINLIYCVLLYLLCKSKIKSKSIFFLFLTILSYIALILTFTRSAILIFLGILFLSIILYRRIIFNFKFLIVILGIIVTTITIPGAHYVFESSLEDGIKIINNLSSFIPDINISFGIGNERDEKEDKYLDYDDDSEFTDYSLQHREAFARIAKKIGKDNITTGVGFGSYIDYMRSDDFSKKYPEYKLSKTHPHSAFTLLFAETGVVPTIFMFLYFALITIGFIINILKNFKLCNDKYYLSCMGFLIIIGFLGVNLIAENAIYDTQIFPIFLIFISLLKNKDYIKNVN